MSTWTDAQTRFAQHLDGYQDRAEQTALALQVEQALAQGQTLLAEAGTGTGKSFATLIPAIHFALRTGKPVVVATATKALQNQLAEKDLPFLQRALGVDFTFTVLKGRGNYACLAKLDDVSDSEVFNLSGIREELASVPEHTGDLDDLVTSFDIRQKGRITSGSEECVGKNDCPFGESCFAEAARERAKKANIIVVNHSVLVRDTLVRNQSAGVFGLLPVYGALIIDEGHNLAEYTTNALGNEFTETGLARFATDAARFIEDESASHKLTGQARLVFNTLGDLLDGNRNRLLTDAHLVRNQDAFIDLYSEIVKLGDRMSRVQVHGDDKKKTAQKRMIRRCNNLGERLQSVLTAESDQLVRWIEVERKGKNEVLALKYAPLHVGQFLRESYWDQVPSVIVSATIAVNGDFGYTARQLGMAEDYVGFEAGTPFDYPKQSALYVPKGQSEKNPKGFPAPTRENEPLVRVYVSNTMRQLVLAAGGRSLLLFTSTTAMKDAHAVLADQFEDAGLRVLMQGEMSNATLTATFKTDETSVLFALKSYMEGIDVPGDALRLVVVDKLPFAVPTDVVTNARMEAADRAVAQRRGIAVRDAKWDKEGSFNGMQIPMATLVVKQAVGRLIRATSDEGLMVVLDSRLNPKAHGGKNYGPGIMRALPDSRQMANLPEAVGYLEELTARRG